MPILLFVAALSGWLQSRSAHALHYPVAHRDTTVDDYHGVSVADPYRWLEQTDSRAATTWVREQDRLATALLTRSAARATIQRRLTNLRDRSAVSVPWHEGGRLFYEMRSGPDKQPILYSQDSLTAAATAILDPNRISRDGSVAVRDYAVSADGRRVAYALAPGGADEAETHVRDLTTGRQSRDVVRGVIGSVCWTRDSRGFFYVASVNDAAAAPTAASGIEKHLAYHVVGEPQEHDRRIREWADYRWGYCMLSEDGRHAIVVAERGVETELFTMNLGSAAQPEVASPLALRLAGGYAHTPIGTIGDVLYVITNRDAPRRQIVALNLDDPTSTIRPVVGESDEVIEEASLTSNRIVIHYLSDVKSRLRLFQHDGQAAGELPLPGVGSVGWGLGARSSQPDLFYSFTTFLTPTTVYHYDSQSGASTSFRAPAAIADANSFETRQVFYRSKDGERVPMFITARRGVALDGRNPTLLTAYGGYGATRKPEFQPDVLLWLRLGGVYALANIRGGGEYGEDWHRAGMLDRKQTSFDDFIAAAEYLLSERVTSSRMLAIYGHSNGGLLIGAAMTQRPDLFAVAVANAGHYDMLRYHRFTVGAGWIPEYGSPDDPTAFRYLRAYSPLHNVRPGTCYPATLLLAADHDDRVVPSHAYKFAATLQAAQSCDQPILLRVAHQASHSYASKDTWIAERSDMWAFISAQMNLAVPDLASRQGAP